MSRRVVGECLPTFEKDHSTFIVNGRAILLGPADPRRLRYCQPSTRRQTLAL